MRQVRGEGGAEEDDDDGCEGGCEEEGEEGGEEGGLGIFFKLAIGRFNLDVFVCMFGIVYACVICHVGVFNGSRGKLKKTYNDLLPHDPQFLSLLPPRLRSRFAVDA